MQWKSTALQNPSHPTVAERVPEELISYPGLGLGHAYWEWSSRQVMGWRQAGSQQVHIAIEIQWLPQSHEPGTKVSWWSSGL